MDDTPLKVKSREELPAGNVAFELVIFCKNIRVVTHRKIPSKTSQNFTSATYGEKNKPINTLSTFRSRLYAQPSFNTTTGSWKLTILTDEIKDEKAGKRKRYWIGRQWHIQKLIRTYIGQLP